MIIIKNTVRSISFNTKQFRHNAQTILDALDYSDFDISIWLTTNKTIQGYNRTYRNKDKATDILSFAFYPQLKAGQRIKAVHDEEKNMGDILISLEYVKKHAQDFEHTFEQRMQVLLVHGICHLLGYDHEKEEDYVVMHKEETRLLRLLTT